MQVATNALGTVHTIDEQGLVERSLAGLIAHAANRHACQFGGRMYLAVNLK